MVCFYWKNLGALKKELFCKTKLRRSNCVWSVIPYCSHPTTFHAAIFIQFIYPKITLTLTKLTYLKQQYTKLINELSEIFLRTYPWQADLNFDIQVLTTLWLHTVLYESTLVKKQFSLDLIYLMSRIKEKLITFVVLNIQIKS